MLEMEIQIIEEWGIVKSEHKNVVEAWNRIKEYCTRKTTTNSAITKLPSKEICMFEIVYGQGAEFTGEREGIFDGAEQMYDIIARQLSQ